MTDVILEIDHPHFVIRVDENLLRIDVKGNVKNEIEEALEKTPILKETIGSILGLFAPLHIRLCDIDSVRMEKTGKVKIVIPHRRDVVVPVKPGEAERLVNKLNQLIPEAKKRELQRIMREHSLQRIGGEEVNLGRTIAGAPKSSESPLEPKPPGMIEEAEKEIEKKIEEENSD